MSAKIVIIFVFVILLVSCATEPKKETMLVSEELTSNYNNSEIKVWIMYGLKLN